MNKLVISLTSMLFLSCDASADLILNYDIYSLDENEKLGKAVLKVSDKVLRTDYLLEGENCSYMTEKWAGRYVIDHNLKHVFVTNYQVMTEHYAPQLKMMASQMPNLSERDIYEMAFDPQSDPSEYLIYAPSGEHQLIGHTPEDPSDIRFRISTVPAVNGIKPLSSDEFNWLLQRVREDIRFGLSGTQLTYQVSELFRHINYQHDAFPYRVEDIDAGFVIELKKIIRGPIDEQGLSISKGYLLQDATKRYLEALDDLAEHLEQE
ncbi:hypothetical protein [Pseudoalteromonas sp. T1lg48]|uniref:hypothetical protein n=1 Tax=Pseudoalteromonas sp. T1lg48 TaxID=2077100 RepID=UPI001319C480|nr:hypothetical protein [Pseudoalteromonas sp. T1lg48]